MAIDNGVVYWSDFSGVTRAATTGGTLLGPTPPPSPQVGARLLGRAMDAAGLHTYFPERNQFNLIDRIVRGDADYDNAATFVQTTRSFEPNLSIALDEPAGRIYWAGSWGADKAGLVQRASVADGSDVQTLLENFTSDDYIVDLALDPAAGKMYIGNSSFRKIQRANLDGSALEDVITDTYVFAMALDTTVPEPAASAAVVLVGMCTLIRRRRGTCIEQRTTDNGPLTTDNNHSSSSRCCLSSSHRAWISGSSWPAMTWSRLKFFSPAEPSPPRRWSVQRFWGKL